MQPPAASPLIHGSTTPMAKEVATAASTASPPASSTAAPTSAARRCCAATTPPRAATTVLRTTCEFEKLSKALLDVADDVGVRCEPHAGIRAHVADELVEDPDAGAVAADVRMHGELEDAAFAVRGVELALEDVEHRLRRGVRTQRSKTVHVEVDRVVADPFHRQLDHAGRHAFHLELVAVDVRHERRVVEEAHFLRDGERVRAEVPRRRADPHGPRPGNSFQNIGGTHLKLALRVARQLGVAFVDPAVDADLVALGDHAPLLVGIEQRSHGRDEKACPYVMLGKDLKNTWHALTVAVLALRQAPDRLAAFAQLVRFVVRVERQRHGAARAAGPALRAQRPTGAHPADDAAPAFLGPLPGCLLAHFLSILRARSVMKVDSFATKRANSAGGMPTPSRPCASNCWRTSGSASAFSVSAWMRETISGGAPAGSQRPNQLIRL